MVTVSYGVTSATLGFNGLTVDQARSKCAGLLNIPPDAKPMLNGTAVDGSHTLGEEDELEFVKPSSTKGN